jgi:hypothetical protein
MQQDLIADIWNIMAEHLPEAKKQDLAQEYINTLLDYGVSEQVLEGVFGIDTYLDNAVEYVIDEEEIAEDDYEDEWD